MFHSIVIFLLLGTLFWKSTDCVHLTDDDDINRMGEKVVLREQVKELFNKKYGKWNWIFVLTELRSYKWKRPRSNARTKFERICSYKPVSKKVV